VASLPEPWPGLLVAPEPFEQPIIEALVATAATSPRTMALPMTDLITLKPPKQGVDSLALRGTARGRLEEPAPRNVQDARHAGEP
jgi:hypothetical protein